MNRDTILDLAKGIGILLVVFCHIFTGNYLNRIVYMFHMPLFFVLTGCTLFYSYKESVKFKDFLRKKAKSILIPYVFFSLLCFFYWIFIERKIRNQIDISILKNFLNIFIAKVNMELYSPNVVMWFLPCLFIMNIIFYIIMKLPNKCKSIAILSLFIFGCILNYYNVILPFAIETALINCIFVFIGYYFKCYSKNLFKNYKISLLIITLFIIIFIFSILTNNNVNILEHKYNNYIIFLLGGVSGSFITIVISYIINKCKIINKVLEWLGINSILIMCMHEPIKRIVIKLISIFTHINIEILRSSFIYSLLILSITIILIYPTIIIINKHFPFITGKKKRYL